MNSKCFAVSGLINVSVNRLKYWQAGVSDLTRVCDTEERKGRCQKAVWVDGLLRAPGSSGGLV